MSFFAAGESDLPRVHLRQAAGKDREGRVPQAYHERRSGPPGGHQGGVRYLRGDEEK